MKKILIIITLCLSSFSFAQRGEKMQERIKAQKIAFITERLNLTSQEAQQFWPIYNAFENKIETIRSKELNPLKTEMRQGDVSDKRANDILDQVMRAENEMHNTKTNLVKELMSVLSAKKILKLKAAEDQFNRILIDRLKKLREKRGNKRN